MPARILFFLLWVFIFILKELPKLPGIIILWLSIVLHRSLDTCALPVCMRVNVTVSYSISLWFLVPEFVLFLSFLLFFPHLISLWLIVPVFFFFSLIFLFVPLPNLIVFFCVRVVFIFVCTLIFSHLISLWLIVPELSRSNILKASSISSSVTFKQSVTLNVVDSVYTKKSLQKEPSQLSSQNSHFSEQVQSTWMFCHFDYFCKNNLWLEKLPKFNQTNIWIEINRFLKNNAAGGHFIWHFESPLNFLMGDLEKRQHGRNPNVFFWQEAKMATEFLLWSSTPTFAPLS